MIADLLLRLDGCRKHRGRDHVVDELLDLLEGLVLVVSEQAETIDRLTSASPSGPVRLVAVVGPPQPKDLL